MLIYPQKISLKKQEQLENRFFEILEEFNKKTDNKGFQSFISDASYKLEEDNEMIIIAACEILMEYGDLRYIEHLKRIGIEGTEEEIRRQIVQIKAKYEIDRENEKAKQKNNWETDFYTMWAFAVEQIGHFPSDILLPEWCGILDILKKKAEINEKINGNGTKRS